MSARWLLIAVSPQKPPLSLREEFDSIAHLSMHLPATSRHAERWEIHRELSETQRSAFFAVAEKYKIDLALLPMPQKKIKLVVFDMDSTLIAGEVINELAKLKGVGPQVQAVTTRAMNGEMDFTQSLHERVALLKGLHRSQLLQVHHHLPLQPGVEKAAKILKANDIHCAIVTGGFTFFAEDLRQKLHFDEAHANTLAFHGDELEGKVKGHIVDANEKLALMKSIATRLGIGLDEVAAVGDGANDLPMIKAAGIGVAFHAKEKVRKEAACAIHFGAMTTLLDYLGLKYDA